MNDAKSNATPIELGEVMEGEVIAEILTSRHDGYREGELVQGRIGWRTHAAVPAVAAASGAVGSLAGQLARLAGARAVGIAEGEARCAYVRRELRFDAAVDQCAANFPHLLAGACPDGIDVYFEIVGGSIWNAVLPLLNRYARVPVCGLLAHYNDTKPSRSSPAAQTMLTILRRSLRIEGFVSNEFAAEHFDSFLRELTPLVGSSEIRYREDIAEGLEAAPRAFIDMLAGRKFGKTLVRVS
jgi:NADPH-dependent curcumin reductase